jgi:hypothetical protein
MGQANHLNPRLNGPLDDGADRRLRGALYLGGIVATSAGLHTLLTGGRSFPPRRQRARLTSLAITRQVV